MTKLNIKFIITVAAIVFASIVIGLGITAVNKINKLNDEIDYLNSRISQIEYDNNSTVRSINDLKNEIRTQLEEQSRNYSDVSYGIKNIYTQNNTASIEVYFSLKEAPLSDKVEVSFGKGNHFETITATKLAGGKYMAEIEEIQIDKNYEISYSASLSSVKTEKILEINLLSRLRNRFSVNSGFYSISRENWQIDFDVTNSYYDSYYGVGYGDNVNKLKIASASLQVFRDDTLIKTININDYKVSVSEGIQYERFASKSIVISELIDDDFKDARVSTSITIVDNYGIEYSFGKFAK